MRKTIIFTLTALLFYSFNAYSQIGKWSAYPAYRNITEIEKAENTLYVLASGGLYAYNKADQSVQTFDKTNALSDTQINHIAWCKAAKRLVIVYQNQNIDLLRTDGEVTNVSDYYRKNMMEDKTIYDLTIDGIYAYLSTGFGIIKLNVRNAEISETYQLGFQVNYTHKDNTYIYAESASKGKYAAKINTNLIDKSNWKRVGEYTPNTEIKPNPDLKKEVEKVYPGGPKHNYFGYMLYKNNLLYTVCGFYESRPACIQVWNGTDWSIYQDDVASLTGHSFLNFSTLDIDPTDVNHVFAGGQTGLYEFKNGAFVKEYNYDNSLFKQAATVRQTTKDYTLVTGIKFDLKGNLWCLNSISPSTSLLQMDKTGQFTSHHKPELMVVPTMNPNRSWEYMTGMILDRRYNLWFVNNFYRTPALAFYQPSIDILKTYTSFHNQDGTHVEVGYVRCVAEDLQGNIWIGTNVGPLVLTTREIETNGNVFQQIKIPRNDGTNYADYLLEGVDIMCMAIDGAGRKWFGTNGNGVYLISEDNLTQLHHFTVENSKLISNYIESIAINGSSGEVFFGTNKGLCSYISNASDASDEMTNDNVWAYPNPVRPDYTGLITVKGLTLNADVKIVSTNGTLVAEGKSNGGLFTWNGKDAQGKRVASGIYLVQTATSNGNKGTVCKIAIVN